MAHSNECLLKFFDNHHKEGIKFVFSGCAVLKNTFFSKVYKYSKDDLTDIIQLNDLRTYICCEHCLSVARMLANNDSKPVIFNPTLMSPISI